MINSPLISIVLCTYNNADSLAITLEHIACQRLTDTSIVEVIVVDNNSPDHTRQVFDKFGLYSSIVFHYFFEPRQGLSHARNTGVEKAKGQYILFTDDDADIPDDWVARYLQKIHEVAPDCLYSKININWEKPVPWWYTNRFRPCFVGLDYGDSAIDVDNFDKEFFGKNFCIKKEIILQYGGFDPALGRNGTRLIAGEETIIYRRLVEEGRRILYFPEAPVGHRLKDREYSEANITKQFIDGAHSSYHVAKLTARKKLLDRPLGVLLDSLTAIPLSLANIVKYAIVRNRQEVFFHRVNLVRSLVLLRLWIIKK